MEGNSGSCTCCSKCCGGFKLVGAVVLLLVGGAIGYFCAMKCAGKGFMCPAGSTATAPATEAPAGQTAQ